MSKEQQDKQSPKKEEGKKEKDTFALALLVIFAVLIAVSVVNTGGFKSPEYFENNTAVESTDASAY